MSISNFLETMAAEQRKRLRQVWALTPEQRMERFAILQTAAEQLLAANPAALAAFHRRNRQRRTEARVTELEKRLRQISPSQDRPK